MLVTVLAARKKLARELQTRLGGFDRTAGRACKALVEGDSVHWLVGFKESKSFACRIF
jgi:hypothetical protein